MHTPLVVLLSFAVRAYTSRELVAPTSSSVQATTWTSAAFQVPHPYATPMTYLENPGRDGCVAWMKVRSSRFCHPHTAWQSTTSVQLGVNCDGCSQLSVSVLAGGCPLGGTRHSLSQTTVTSTPYTHFGFTCAPTPAAGASSHSAPSGSVRTTDVEVNLPLPTLLPGQSPLYTPVAMSALLWPDGQCFATLSVAPSATAEVRSACAAAASTSYSSTVTSMVSVDCAGCRMLSVVGEDCPEAEIPPQDSQVIGSGTFTKWGYVCG